MEGPELAGSLRKEEGAGCGPNCLPADQASMGRGMEDEKIMSTERQRREVFSLA